MEMIITGKVFEIDDNVGKKRIFLKGKDKNYYSFIYNKRTNLSTCPKEGDELLLTLDSDYYILSVSPKN